MAFELSFPRTAIVTGGGRRIGAAIVRAMAADGWMVLIHCHESIEGAQALADEVGNARVAVSDLGAANPCAPIEALLEDMPPVGLLVNNASRFAYDDLDDFTSADWDAHFNINLRAPALLTQMFARIAKDGGLIINLIDAKLAAPNPDFFSYTLSKAGLAALTDLSARRLAARQIRVCGIAPSITLASGKQSRKNFSTVHALNALGRGVHVDQIIDALRFIIATPTLTGQTITIDAGQHFLSLPRDVQFMDEQ